MVLPFAYLSLFPLGSADSRVIFILTPGPVLLRVLVQTERCPAPPGQPGSMPTQRLAHPVCPENEIRATPNRICWHIGRFADLVLPLSKCLVTGIPRLIGSSWEKDYPSLTVRANNGLSWDTPAGYKLSRAVPAVIWQMGIC